MVLPSIRVHVCTYLYSVQGSATCEVLLLSFWEGTFDLAIIILL